MIGLLIAAVGALGIHLLFTARTSDRRERDAALTAKIGTARDTLGRLAELAAVEIVAFSVLLALVGGALGYAMFGSVAPAVLLAAFAAWLPVASFRVRRKTALAQAQEAWPRMIEEIRVLAGAAGRSLPLALFDTGLRGPTELRPAFEEAHREWLLSTDFERTLDVLKERLADPTADAVCETLLIAHELGGSDVDRRLGDLAQDRLADTIGRKDARARQAGARFARMFVLIVPAGMALTGMQLGTGRSAYQTSWGQLAVLAAIAVVVGCWVWAGSIMRLPTEERVLASTGSSR